MDIRVSNTFDLLDEKRTRGETINIHAEVTDLVNRGVRAADAFDAFEEVLNDPTAFNWHYYALSGMRALAVLDELPRDKARILLEKTDRFAWQMGIDEFYKSIEAVAHSPKTVPALLDFVEERLLNKRDIQEWRWLAFTAIASILQSGTKFSEIMSALNTMHSLKDRLGQEIGKEDDPMRNSQLEAIINQLP